MRSPFKRRSPIGLDIGAHSVKAVQSVRSGGAWKIASLARFPRSIPGAPISAAEIVEVKAVLYRQGFTGRDVIIPANGEKVLSGALELPSRRAEIPMDQIARAEFARIHKCNLAAAEFCWWELPVPARAGKGTHVMAVAYPHADAESQLSVYDQAGLCVQGLDTPVSALGRACMTNAGNRGTIAAVDLGWRGVGVVLLRDGVLAYERRILTGGLSKLHAAVGARLRIDAAMVEQLIQEIGIDGPVGPDTSELASEARPMIVAHFDAIAEEILKACGYAAHQYPDAPVELAMLVGGGACISGVPERFGSTLKMEVRTPKQDQVLNGDTGSDRRATSSHAPAAALATFLN